MLVEACYIAGYIAEVVVADSPRIVLEEVGRMLVVLALDNLVVVVDIVLVVVHIGLVVAFRLEEAHLAAGPWRTSSWLRRVL